MHEAGPWLVATDFSAGARMAADRAARLAAQLRQGLVLIHVVPDDALAALKGWMNPATAWDARLTEVLRLQLQEEQQRLTQTFGVDVTSVMLEGHAVMATDAEATDVQASCLVVGALGSSRVQHLMLGTTAERLLRKTSHPLLTVRQPAVRGYERVLLPLDFSAWSLAAITLARTVAPDARLYLVHTFTVPFEEKLRFAGVDDATIDLYRHQTREAAYAQLQALAMAAGLPADGYVLRLVEGDAAPSLVEEAETHGCDLVVIGKHGRNAAEELLLGSVTKHVLAEVRCDVLVSTQRVG